MPDLNSLSDYQLRAVVAVIRGIISDEIAIADGQSPSSDLNNTERINDLIAAEGLAEWNRDGLGRLMNKMRAVLKEEAGEVGVTENGTPKVGPARYPESLAARMRALGLV